MSTDSTESQDHNQDKSNPTADAQKERYGGASAVDAAAEATSSSGDQQATSDEGSAEDGELLSLRARVAELEEEVSDLKDRYIRKQADFENFRKRMLREQQTAAEFSNKQLLLDIVTIIDDFERAIKSAEESQDFDAFHSGVLLIEKQFTSMLERKWGLKRFDSVGEEFDPQKHEAVATEENPVHDTSMVVEDYQKGYYLHDKVLRSAKVKVSMPGSRASSEQSE